MKTVNIKQMVKANHLRQSTQTKGDIGEKVSAIS
jgi:hypothetical protein